jgi:hypothetical protein
MSYLKTNVRIKPDANESNYLNATKELSTMQENLSTVIKEQQIVDQQMNIIINNMEFNGIDKMEIEQLDTLRTSYDGLCTEENQLKKEIGMHETLVKYLKSATSKSDN